MTILALLNIFAWVFAIAEITTSEKKKSSPASAWTVVVGSLALDIWVAAS